MSAGWSTQDGDTFWSHRSSHSILRYEVSDRRLHQVLTNVVISATALSKVKDIPSSVSTTWRRQTAKPLSLPKRLRTSGWVRLQSWSYCGKCEMFEPRKLQPSFARRTPTLLHTASKCGNATYTVPSVDDVPLVLCHITPEEQHILSPFEIHCGEYVCHFKGYCQRTGPFRVSWCATLVEQKIHALRDQLQKQRCLQPRSF